MGRWRGKGLESSDRVRFLDRQFGAGQVCEGVKQRGGIGKMALNRDARLQGCGIDCIPEQAAGFGCGFVLEVLRKLETQEHQSGNGQGISARENRLGIELLDEPLPPRGVFRKIISLEAHHHFVWQVAEVAWRRLFVALESEKAAQIFKILGG